jgi:hypothetical protein
LVFATLVATQVVQTGCVMSWEGKDKAERNREWIRSDTTVYYFDQTGGFRKTRANSNQSTLISSRKTHGWHGFQISRNGKYLVYHDTLMDQSKTVFVIYDVENRSERVFFEIPRPVAANVEFSPDSTRLAVLIYMHTEKLGKKRLCIFDLPSMNTTFVPYPPHAKLLEEKAVGRLLAWSSDGRWLYLAFDSRPTTHIQEYHRLDVKTHTYSPADGVWSGVIPYTFTQNWRPVDRHWNKSPQSQSMYTRLPSPDKKYTAYISDNVLKLDTDAKKGIVVSKGDDPYPCGPTLSIISWLPHSHYLVYENREIAYIYEASTGRRAVLFNRSKVPVFGWHDPAL